MGVEIERKFLVTGDVPLETATASVDIRQGYLAQGGGIEVRVRLAGAVAAALAHNGGPD